MINRADGATKRSVVGSQWVSMGPFSQRFVRLECTGCDYFWARPNSVPAPNTELGYRF